MKKVRHMPYCLAGNSQFGTSQLFGWHGREEGASVLQDSYGYRAHSVQVPYLASYRYVVP